MKNIFKAFTGVALSLFLLSACNVENIKETYSPVLSSEVSFAQANITSTAISASQTTFPIDVTRSTATSAVTVPVTATLVDGITCPSSISFAAGEYSTTLDLDISGMAVGKSYNCSITMTDTTTFNKNIANIKTSLTLAKAYTWVSQGNGQWFDNVALTYTGSLGIQSVEILKAEGFDRWRILNPYPKAAIIKAWGEEYYGGETISYIEFWKNADGTIRWNGLLMPGIIYVDIAANAYVRGYYPLDYQSSHTAQAANCKFVVDKVAQFYTAYVIENSTSWFGYQQCFVSLPGGPDLNEFLK